jgi:adenine phosphoribosyltransferase
MPEMTLNDVKALLRPVPNFPIDGIMFQDIFPIFQNAEAMKLLVKTIGEHIKSIGGVEVYLCINLVSLD